MRISQYNRNIHTDSPTIGEVDVISVWNPEEFGILVLFSQFCKNSENNTRNTRNPKAIHIFKMLSYHESHSWPTESLLEIHGETWAFPSISSIKKLVVSLFVHLNMMVFTKNWCNFRGWFSWMVKLGLGISTRPTKFIQINSESWGVYYWLESIRTTCVYMYLHVYMCNIRTSISYKGISDYMNINITEYIYIYI